MASNENDDETIIRLRQKLKAASKILASASADQDDDAIEMVTNYSLALFYAECGTPELGHDHEANATEHFTRFTGK